VASNVALVPPRTRTFSSPLQGPRHVVPRGSTDSTAGPKEADAPCCRSRPAADLKHGIRVVVRIFPHPAQHRVASLVRVYPRGTDAIVVRIMRGHAKVKFLGNGGGMALHLPRPRLQKGSNADIVGARIRQDTICY